MNEGEDVCGTNDISDNEDDKDNQQNTKNPTTRIEVINLLVNACEFGIGQAVDAAVDLLRTDTPCL